MKWQTLVAWGRVALIVAAALGLVALAAWLWLAHWQPSRDDYHFQGVDVSDAAGEIDWVTVREAGADFAYVRASFGADGRDSRFDSNWRATAAAALRHGAYLDYSLCRLASDQADLFNTIVAREDDALPPAVFVDYTPGCTARPEPRVVVGEVARLMAMIENHAGKPALLRVSPAFDREYGLSAAIPRPIWATGNVFPPDYAARPWRMWQANDRRWVAGIAQPVHWDVVHK